MPIIKMDLLQALLTLQMFQIQDILKNFKYHFMPLI